VSRLRIDPLTVEFVDDDITAQATDAIVNAANNAFWMGAGVAGAIKARGGQAIEDEAMAQGPVDPGGCVLTAAGRLAARHVIHAAVMGQDLRTSAALIEASTRCALEMAERHRMASIAFPAFGTGVGGFPVDECGRTMIRPVRAHAAVARSLTLVRFVLFGQIALTAFERAARDAITQR
jgi:O-acetyl-ADP-ribose deacetylase (regulator of RNase III)